MPGSQPVATRWAAPTIASARPIMHPPWLANPSCQGNGSAWGCGRGQQQAGPTCSWCTQASADRGVPVTFSTSLRYDSPLPGA